MSSRRLIFHTFFCVVSVGGVLYNTLYLRTPSEERFGWKFQFLTYINAWMQAIYWCIAVAAGLSTQSYDSSKRRGTIHRLFDTLHTSLAFPVGLFVCITFWMIYAVDRELVYPKHLDALIPQWLNHVMHTIHLPFLIIDKYLVLHRYPSQRYGMSILILFAALYNSWILYLALEKDIWVYPILEVMNWTYRIVFFVLLWCFFLLLYKTGELITIKFWGIKMVKKHKAK